MDVTKGFDNHVIIDLTQDEAIKMRRWMDEKNEEVDTLIDDISDKIFDLTYTPVR